MRKDLQILGSKGNKKWMLQEQTMYVAGWPRENLAKITYKSASLQCNSVKLSNKLNICCNIF
jgi:hypothetical protein